MKVTSWPWSGAGGDELWPQVAWTSEAALEVQLFRASRHHFARVHLVRDCREEFRTESRRIVWRLGALLRPWRLVQRTDVVRLVPTGIAPRIAIALGTGRRRMRVRTFEFDGALWREESR